MNCDLSYVSIAPIFFIHYINHFFLLILILFRNFGHFIVITTIKIYRLVLFDFHKLFIFRSFTFIPFFSYIFIHWCLLSDHLFYFYFIFGYLYISLCICILVIYLPQRNGILFYFIKRKKIIYNYKISILSIMFYLFFIYKYIFNYSINFFSLSYWALLYKISSNIMGTVCNIDNNSDKENYLFYTNGVCIQRGLLYW